MTWELLLEAVLKSAAVPAMALLFLHLARGRCAAERAWIAHAGILLALLAPIVALWGPDWEAAWLPALGGAALDGAAATPTTPVAAGGPLQPQAGPDPAVSSPHLLIAAYGAVAGLMLLELATSVARLLLLKRSAQVLTAQPWLSALAHAQQRMGFKHGAALLISDEVASPVSWGLFRPTIVLDRAAVEAPEQAEAVIAHELAHVVRLDWANLMVARLGAALLWFNPLVWMLAREAHQLREEAADDAVLRGAVPGPDYASLLLGVARHENRGALSAAHGVAPGKYSLKRRLVRVLNPDLPRGPTGRGWRVYAAACALLVAGPLAAFTPVAALDEAASSPGGPAKAHPFTKPLPAPAQPSRQEPMDAAAPAAVAVPVRSEVVAPTAAAVPIPVSTPRPVAAPALTTLPPSNAAAGDRRTSVEAGRLSPELLTQMRLHQVTPEWIAAVQAEMPRLRGAEPQQLIGMAVLRVRPEWLRELKAAGYRDLTPEQITSLAAHRVGADYVRELAAAGYRDLTVAQLLSMKVHRVDAAYIRTHEGGVLTQAREPARTAGETRSQPPPSLPPSGAPPPVSSATRF